MGYFAVLLMLVVVLLTWVIIRKNRIIDNIRLKGKALSNRYTKLTQDLAAKTAALAELQRKYDLLQLESGLSDETLERRFAEQIFEKEVGNPKMLTQLRPAPPPGVARPGSPYDEI